jgi:tRNA threonylcarbamoyladenosine biosynthesis protein TsaE
LSPTFVIARVHRDGRVPLVHVDAYRLGSVEEVDDLDLDADLDASVTVVEWGAGLVERLSGDRLDVRITRPSGDTDDETRHVRIAGVGHRWESVIAALDN